MDISFCLFSSRLFWYDDDVHFSKEVVFMRDDDPVFPVEYGSHRVFDLRQIPLADQVGLKAFRARQ